MYQFDRFIDEDIIKQQDKRLEDVKGMRDCCMCAHCFMRPNLKLFEQGMYKCHAKKIWKERDDRFEYNCIYFTARSCLNCLYYGNEYRPCSVAEERLRNGVDMRYSICSMYRNKAKANNVERRSILGRVLIDSSFKRDMTAMYMETKWLIDQVAQGNGHYVKARRYSGEVRQIMLDLYAQLKSRYEQKIARDEDAIAGIKEMTEKGYIYGEKQQEEDS